MALEEEFDVEVPDDEAEKLQAVKDVVTFITSKKADPSDFKFSQGWLSQGSRPFFSEIKTE